MKSILKVVAPVAMTITFAVSGIAMAETAPAAAKNAEAATATATTNEAAKPVTHKHHDASKKAEQASSKDTTAPAVAEKTAAEKSTQDKSVVEKTTTEKATTTVATVDKTAGKTVEQSKSVEAVKTK